MNKFEALKLVDDNDNGSDKEENDNQQNGNIEENGKDKNEEGTVASEFGPTPEVGPGEHRLQFPYAFWFSKRYSNKTSSGGYESSIKLIGSFSTVEQFWSYYAYMVRPGDLPGNSNVHLFKHGIRPMWEDEANKEGGKWILRLRKGLASRYWENLILAILGEQFMVDSELCGAVVSLRFQDDIISVWNKNAQDQNTINRIRDTLRRILNLPQNTIMEYKAHSDSPNYRSSIKDPHLYAQDGRNENKSP
ncbi:eukaryotic translation initiation factor 4E type 2-like [Rhopilema esculentum]|uniref:eukaryotic translation initiation factor 4E type 2-like n=1 Tax=Rhopilema esculentum TaxID=499914 RepID=UPI0031E32014|eukprot:gene16904-8391_t